MINFIRMKKNEWKVKAMFYGTIAALMEQQKDILKVLQKMYVSFKDVPAEELRNELISKLAEMIHEEKNA